MEDVQEQIIELSQKLAVDARENKTGDVVITITSVGGKVAVAMGGVEEDITRVLATAINEHKTIEAVFSVAVEAAPFLRLMQGGKKLKKFGPDGDAEVCDCPTCT